MKSFTESKFLNDDELNILLSLLKKHDGERDALLLGLLLNTGARGIEILRVQKKDLGKDYVLIHGAKRSKDRSIPLPPHFMLALRKHTSSLSDTDRLFPMSTRHLRRIWDLYRPSSKLGLHSLRHTFGVKLYNASRDIHAVHNALGHVSIKSSDFYLQFVEGQKKMKKYLNGMWKKRLE